MGSRVARVLTYLALLQLLAGCAHFIKSDLRPGTRLIEIDAPGDTRTYWLHIPDINFDNPPPLVVVLHGTGGNGERMLAIGDFVNHANSEKYVVAAPNSLGRAFNEGSGRIGKTFMHVDDVAFIEGVIQDVADNLPIDAGQVFVTGLSSGGAMAQRFALETEIPIAALASVSGHLWVPGRQPRIPRPLLLMFGDTDPLNPVDGGPVRYGPDLVLDKPSQQLTARRWAERLHCVNSVRTSMGLISQRHWYGCDDGVPLIFLTIDATGHYWPGGPTRFWNGLPPALIGPYQGRVDATSVIWEFFRQSVP